MIWNDLCEAVAVRRGAAGEGKQKESGLFPL